MKKIVVWMVCLSVLMAVGTAVATTIKCTVEYKKDDIVFMICKDVDKLKVGQKVKVKIPSKKGPAVEGC